MRFRKLRMAGRLALLGMALLLIVGCTGQNRFTLAPESVLPAFVMDLPPRVRDAYRFAVANPEELAKYPCFCGCGNMGHTSNLSCYVQDIAVDGSVTFDDHAAGCGICVDIAQDVMRLLNEGRSSHDIRFYIDAQYSSFGPSTNTPLPD